MDNKKITFSPREAATGKDVFSFGTISEPFMALLLIAGSQAAKDVLEIANRPRVYESGKIKK